MTEIVTIPFHNGEVLAVEADGKPRVILRPALEHLGVDYSTQLAKLRRRSWASVGLCPTQDQYRDMVTVDVRTFLMLLATIDESRVAPEVRSLLVAYQNEVADVIDRHFNRDGSAYDPAPFTWTFDETCAILRQRYKVQYNPITLRQALISSGLFKQVGSPRADFASCFYFTGSAWTVHPHMLKRVAGRLLKLHRAISASHDEQLALVAAPSP